MGIEGGNPDDVLGGGDVGGVEGVDWEWSYNINGDIYKKPIVKKAPTTRTVGGVTYEWDSSIGDWVKSDSLPTQPINIRIDNNPEGITSSYVTDPTNGDKYIVSKDRNGNIISKELLFSGDGGTGFGSGAPREGMSAQEYMGGNPDYRTDIVYTGGKWKLLSGPNAGATVTPSGQLISPANADSGEAPERAGSPTSGLWERDPKTGKWYIAIPATDTPSAPRSSSSGGSSSGGGVSQSVRSGGYTNTNIDDITPAAAAARLAEAATPRTSISDIGPVSAGLKREELETQKVSNIIKNLSNPNDMVEREYSTRALGVPSGSSYSLGGGFGPVNQTIGNMVNLPSTSTPSAQTPSPTSSPTVPSQTEQGLEEGDTGSNIDQVMQAYRSANPDQSRTGAPRYGWESPSEVVGGPETWTYDNKMKVSRPVDTMVDESGNPVAKPKSNVMTADSEKVSTIVNGLPVDRLAGGMGMTNARMMMMGDAPMPQRPDAGGRSPEMMINWTGAPVTVLDNEDTEQVMDRMPVSKTIPRFEGGTYLGFGGIDPSLLGNLEVFRQEQQQASQPAQQPAQTTTQPVQAPAQPQPAAQPVANPATTATPPAPTTVASPPNTTPVSTPSTTASSAASSVASRDFESQPLGSPAPVAAPSPAPLSAIEKSTSMVGSGTPTSIKPPVTEPTPPIANTVSSVVPPPTPSTTIPPTTTLQSPSGTIPASSLISYPDEAYQNLPSLRYLRGDMDRPSYMTQAVGNRAASFGSQLPEAGSINAARAYDISQDPDAYAVLDSLYRSGNRNLASTLVNVFRRFGQVGQGKQTSQIMT